MSVHDEIRRLTAPDIRARKSSEPIVCLTSYHAHTAGIVDRYCDIILVGSARPWRERERASFVELNLVRKEGLEPPSIVPPDPNATANPEMLYSKLTMLTLTQIVSSELS